MGETQRIVVGISGASAPIYGIRVLEVLRDLPGVETHLTMSEAAERTIVLETDWTVEQVRALAHVVHDNKNIAASISSGSFRTVGMVIAPCSINTLSAVSNSTANDLLTRAADVTLKERRPLVLVVRETPLHIGHLRHMIQAAENGAIILPPVPGFYHHPKTIDDLINHTVGKVLDVFGFPHNLFKRWTGAPAVGARTK
ncbi:MAG: UbiX family flavin prenyltransferase [Acidobacteria bacterium]|nr:UbiX family flavin prenyltransferase [Acidobacteriota bacterium]